MKSPFVSRSLFEMAVARADAEHENAQALRRDLANQTERWIELLGKEDAKYSDLLDKYHTLRQAGFGHVETLPMVASPDLFGPKTRTMLDAMSKGQPRDVRVAMEKRAAEMVAMGGTDDVVSEAVRRGERGVRIAV